MTDRMTTGPEQEDRVKTYTVIESPIGPLTAVATDGALSCLHMGGPADLRESLDEMSPAGFDHLREELAQYFDRQRTEFTVATKAQGTPFQKRVWQRLTEIPYGQTRTYGELARDLGDPKLVRAVGAANGRNPIGIIVPCHRVIGADGTLVGYAGGLSRKEFLLSLENPPTTIAETLF
jgi:methylated-DNA-[protein]-cysteine S-methyltransferase